MTRGWEALVDGYLVEYGSRGLAAGTVARVRSVLEHWGQWLRGRRPRPRVEQVDVDLLVRYLRSRTSFRSKSTVYGTLSVMRGMGDYLVREGVWLTNPLRWMKGPKVTPYSRLPMRIDASHMAALWRAAAAARGAYWRHAWVTVLALLYGTGLRRGELERLDVASWDRTTGVLRIDGRKTGRERCVPVPALVGQCLEAYLPQRHNWLEHLGQLTQPALLVGREGTRLTGATISTSIHRLARTSGIPLRSLHQFRHSCASDLLEAGVGLPEVQQILGHQVIATTVRYVHIADPERRAAMARHPINAWLLPEAA
jgi:site-specific recombinase XerD